MGIGGAGMAPLAELVRRSGGEVTGCDGRHSPTLDSLAGRGVVVAVGHSPMHVEGCSALVVTSAIPRDHPEIAAAREAAIPVIRRAEALGAIVNRGTVVGVAGTHGKTTTTALTTYVLESAGLQPTGVVGGRVRVWDGNLRHGDGSIYVVEADEYDHSFLSLEPTVAVVTTLEADHLDVFGSLGGVEKAFLDYIERVRRDGVIVACGDDHGVGRLIAARSPGGPPVVTYGLGPGSMLRAEDVAVRGRTTTFTVRERGRRLGSATLNIPGLHNVRNSLAAIGVGRFFGVEWKAIAPALEQYRGVDRRFEIVGEKGGVLVVDDYAHHPTEIEATLAAARAAYPDRRIVAVFQPHLYSRTRDFAEGFGRALARADLLFVTDIYPAREAPIEGVTGEMIVAPARAAGADVRYLPDRATVAAEVAAELRENDVCLTLGAGDLDAAAREILDRIDDGDDS